MLYRIEFTNPFYIQTQSDEIDLIMLQCIQLGYGKYSALYLTDYYM